MGQLFLNKLQQIIDKGLLMELIPRKKIFLLK